MVLTDLQRGLENFTEELSSQTYLGTYRTQRRDSLLADGLGTRANSIWKMAQYIIATYDNNPNIPIESYLNGWRTLVKNYKNQYLIIETNEQTWRMYDSYSKYLGDEQFIQDYLRQHACKAVQNTSSLPLQQIYFGAPGTGKSHAVKEQTKDYSSTTIRTTFHPDSDYASFVGCYKPSMRSVKQTYINEGEQKPVLNAQKEQVCKDEIVYAYTPQAFLQAYTLAWQRLQDNTPVFLIIEEINRGNCAQIFGNLFQLLDRSADGYSEYAIRADRDMQDYLHQTLGDYAALSPDIASGEELQLPPNLHIWATMNTSDQSLFPIDSAFKRRWQWKYCPITDAGLNYQIAAGDKKYDWWKVISFINQEIENVTKSEDKKLGYFFVQADHDNIITADTFVNKVVFYLWNDVFRDAYANSLFADGLTFYRFFLPDGNTDTAVLQQFLARIPGSESPA